MPRYHQLGAVHQGFEVKKENDGHFQSHRLQEKSHKNMPATQRLFFFPLSSCASSQYC